MIFRIKPFTLAIICLLVSVSAGFAQSFIQNSSAQDVAFTFYKTAGATPHYERWVKASEPYLSTPQAKWAKVLEDQKNFLRTSFDKFDPESDLIITKIKARAMIERPDDPEIDPMVITLRFPHEREDREIFLPYEFGGDNFAVIIDDLNERKVFEIPPKETPYVTSHLGNREITAVFRLAAISADIEKPFMMGEEAYWLLATNIASLSLWNKTGVLVYEYIAPWYFSPANEDIGSLKTKQEEIRDLLSIEIDPILMPIQNP